MRSFNSFLKDRIGRFGGRICLNLRRYCRCNCCSSDDSWQRYCYQHQQCCGRNSHCLTKKLAVDRWSAARFNLLTFRRTQIVLSVGM